MRTGDAQITLLDGACADVNALENDACDVGAIAAVANDPDLVRLALDLCNRPDLIPAVTMVRRLIAAGAPLDHVKKWAGPRLSNGRTRRRGPDHVATVRALLDAGADTEIGDRQGLTPLLEAAAVDSPHTGAAAAQSRSDRAATLRA